MDRIKVMVNGIPGNMAVNVAKHVIEDDMFELLPYALTGPEITETECKVDSVSVRLINPQECEKAIVEIKEKENHFISVDYTHPSAVNSNAGFYCNQNLPFVMGTTGGDRQLLEDTVRLSLTSPSIYSAAEFR